MKHTFKKGEIKSLPWVTVTEDTAACCPSVSGAGGIATRLFFHRLSGMRGRGRMGCLWFGGFWHFQATAYSESQEAETVTKCSSWMALTDGGSSRPKGQWKTPDWQCVAACLSSSPLPLGGRLYHTKERSVEAVMWMETLEKTDMTSAMQQEISAVHASPQVLQWNQQWLRTSCALQKLQRCFL